MIANDDLALSKEPFRVIAVVPVKGRLPLLPYTIKRLLHKNGCAQVICVGDGKGEKEVCEEAGAIWISYPNKPLGDKWNHGFLAARQFNPDACLYVGSSDWLSNDWLTIMQPYLKEHKTIGVPGCYFMDIGGKIRVVNWKGYVGERSNETIGIGRLLSREILDRINWKPFDQLKDSSLDRSMKEITSKHGAKDYMVLDSGLKAVSLSTNLWENKHQFMHHWGGLIPSDKVEDVERFLLDFPEAKQLQKDLCSATLAKV